MFQVIEHRPRFSDLLEASSGEHLERLPPRVRRQADNALRHGLTAPPDRGDAEVVALCQILRSELGPAGSEIWPPRELVELARAEVQVRRVARCISQIQSKLAARVEAGSVLGSPEARGYRALLDKLSVPTSVAEDPDHFIHGLMHLEGDLALLDPITASLEALRLLTRYRQEAESWRRKALRAWSQTVHGLEEGQ